MTRAQQDAHWSGAPSLSQLWLAALLRLAAMLVSNVAATFGMTGVLLSRDWHTKVEPAGLPQETHDTIEETEPAEANSQSTYASHKLAHHRECHPGSAHRDAACGGSSERWRYPEPIPQQPDSPVDRARLSAALTLRSRRRRRLEGRAAAGTTTIDGLRVRRPAAP